MINQILEERGLRYGDFKDHAEIAQGLQQVLRKAPNWDNMPADARQSMVVITDKMARMLNGDPSYDDNWIDIIGYATLVLNRIKDQERDKEELVKEAQKQGFYDSIQTNAIKDQKQQFSDIYNDKKMP